jgi:hypothetical protein
MKRVEENLKQRQDLLQMVALRDALKEALKC